MFVEPRRGSLLRGIGHGKRSAPARILGGMLAVALAVAAPLLLADLRLATPLLPRPPLLHEAAQLCRRAAQPAHVLSQVGEHQLSFLSTQIGRRRKTAPLLPEESDRIGAGASSDLCSYEIGHSARPCLELRSGHRQARHRVAVGAEERHVEEQIRLFGRLLLQRLCKQRERTVASADRGLADRLLQLSVEEQPRRRRGGAAEDVGPPPRSVEQLEGPPRS
mmetsp:Transcript_42067/g.136544  ORF Transcript_42067/g.136544 Transcript_42067/m.136544 type:complete len:221 (-) Transcript_42067:447-1109(-)